MTIEVRVTNQDERRTVIVRTVEYEGPLRGQGNSHTSLDTEIEPRGSRQFYVHLLREIRVSEKTP